MTAGQPDHNNLLALERNDVLVRRRLELADQTQSGSAEQITEQSLLVHRTSVQVSEKRARHLHRVRVRVGTSVCIEQSVATFARLWQWRTREREEEHGEHTATLVPAGTATLRFLLPTSHTSPLPAE